MASKREKTQMSPKILAQAGMTEKEVTDQANLITLISKIIVNKTIMEYNKGDHSDFPEKRKS